MKTVEIKIPEGFELKQVSEGKWELVKEEPTLEQILGHSYTSSLKTFGTAATIHYNDDEQQIEKLSALSKLMCVAKYLNGGWKPDWNDGHSKYLIAYSYDTGELFIPSQIHLVGGDVAFKTEELARKAIAICGEGLIKRALGI